MKKNVADDTRPVAVVLLSGGLDSSVALARTAVEGFRCIALLVDYGQPHARLELTCARHQARARKAEVIRLDLSRARLAQTGGANVSPHYVPGRNTILVAYALSVAEARGASRVVLGVTREDWDREGARFPDCSPDYLRALRGVATIGMAKAPAIEAPFLMFTKGYVVDQGRRLGVDFARTRSCYAATEAPCGTCGACVTRARAFASECMADPALRSMS